MNGEDGFICHTFLSVYNICVCYFNECLKLYYGFVEKFSVTFHIFLN